MTPDFREDLRQMSCFIPQTDIPQFVYKLHTLFGDYHSDLIENMEKLVTGTASDYIAIMSDNHIALYEASFAYCHYGEIYEMILAPEYQAAYLFCLHMDQAPDAPCTGSVLLTDVKKLKDDTRDNGILPMGIKAIRESGRRANIPMERWYRMDLPEKQKLQFWQYQYSPNGLSRVNDHYAAVLKGWQEAACPMQEKFLMDRFNEGYMAAAQHPQEKMYRIPYLIASKMAIQGDASVFRLFPDGPKELAPVTVISRGFLREKHLEFAVRQDDLNALEAFTSQAAKRIMETYCEKPHRKRRAKDPIR